MSRAPLIEDLDSIGRVNIVYSVDDSRALTHNTIPTHRWFTGELTEYEREDKKIILLGWYPGESTVGYRKWILQHRAPTTVIAQESVIPSKRRIRIDED